MKSTNQLSPLVRRAGLSMPVLLLMTFMQAGAAHAQNVWSNGTGNGNWSLASNWSGGQPLTPNTAAIGASGNGTAGPRLAVNRTIMNLTMSAKYVDLAAILTVTNNVTISGGRLFGTSRMMAKTLAFSGGTIETTVRGMNTVTLSGTAEVKSNGTLDAPAGNFTQTDSAIMAGTVNAADYAISSGTISGTVNAATFSITGGEVTGTVNARTSFDLQDADGGTITGTLGGAGTLNKTTASVVTLSGNNTYSGDTIITNGELIVIGSIASRKVLLSGGKLQAHGGSAIGDSVDIDVTGTGTFDLATRESIGSLSGSSTGTINVNAQDLDIAGSGDTTTFAGIISGTGGLIKSGTDHLTLTGTSSFTGATTINGGLLTVNGVHTATSLTTINSGGSLGGTGMLSDTTVASGGMIGPGNSIGTLNIAGTFTAAAGSTYDVEVASDGTSDRIAVAGSAVLQGGNVKVRSTAIAGQFGITPSEFTILSATGGITGTFNAAVDTSAVAFFNGSLNYATANEVKLVLTRNDIALADVAQTGNQRNTAEAVSALDMAHPIYAGIMAMSSTEAQSAYEQLSGEGYASASQEMVATAGLVSQAGVDRVQQTFDVLDSAGASSYMPGGYVASGAPQGSAWMSAYGARSTIGAGNGTSGLNADAGGLLGGLDGDLGDWRLGAMLGYGQSVSQVAALGTTVKSNDYTVGAYAGREWGSLQLVLGASYTRHDLAGTRNLALPSVQSLNSSYQADSTQFYGQLANEFNFGAVSIEPYAGLQYVRTHAGAFTEKGGNAALSAATRTTNDFFTRLGLRGAVQFVLGDDMLLKLGAGLGWKRSFADTALASNSLAGAGFVVAGATRDQDALSLETSVALDLSEALALKLDYAGEMSLNTHTHQVRARLTARF